MPFLIKDKHSKMQTHQNISVQVVRWYERRTMRLLLWDQMKCLQFHDYRCPGDFALTSPVISPFQGQKSRPPHAPPFSNLLLPPPPPPHTHTHTAHTRQGSFLKKMFLYLDTGMTLERWHIVQLIVAMINIFVSRISFRFQCLNKLNFVITTKALQRILIV